MLMSARRSGEADMPARVRARGGTEADFGFRLWRPPMSKKTHSLAKAKNLTKSAKIITLLQGSTGATIAELAKATGWQRLSVRGFMSGTLKRKRCLKIESNKEENKERRYWITAGAR